MGTSKRNHHRQVRHPRISGEAPVFYECPICGFLVDEKKLTDDRLPCPLCGAVEGPRRRFPTDRLRRLDARIRDYHHDNENEIVVILVAAFLEAVLEDILDRIMSARGADLEVRKLVLDNQRAIGARVGRVFPQLTHHEFEEVAAELGYRDFPHHWRELRAARNGFIHDSPFNGPRESIDASMGRQGMELLDQAYRLFVSVNNRFVADGVSAHLDHGIEPPTKTSSEGREEPAAEVAISSDVPDGRADDVLDEAAGS